MSIATKMVQSIDLSRKLGLREATIHFGRAAMTRWRAGERFRLFLMELKITSLQDSLPVQSGYQCRFLTVEELQFYAKAGGYNLCKDDLVSNESENRCLGQFASEKLVGYSWLSFSGMVDLGWGLHFNLPDDMAYNYNGYTLPAYRGGGLQGLRHLAILKHAQLAGKTRLFAYVDHLNYRSLHGVRKSGYRPIGAISGLKRDGKLRFVLDVEDAAWSDKVRLGPIQGDHLNRRLV